MMTVFFKLARASFFLAVLTLAACASAPEATTVKRKKPRPPTPADWLVDIRAAGASVLELEVQPLRDAQSEDLRQQAQALEARGKIKPADAVLLKALAITPDDPELWQWRAELALLKKDWKQAAALANQSYARGPKLGGLCRRNWQTVYWARIAQKNPAAAEVAKQQGERCTIAPPVRM